LTRTVLRPTSSKSSWFDGSVERCLAVCNMLYQRDGGVDVTVDCPKNLIIATDCAPETGHAQPGSQLNQVCSFRFYSISSSCCWRSC
jgi:hypothetical protein